jgi:protein-disulfide isomerase
MHPHAEKAALAAICAEHQDRFPQMHDYFMTESEWMQGLPWEEVATAAGISSVSEFIECLGSGAAARRLAADMETARRLGVRSTPTFVTEREVRSGAQGVDELQTMLAR